MRLICAVLITFSSSAGLAGQGQHVGKSMLSSVAVATGTVAPGATQYESFLVGPVGPVLFMVSAIELQRLVVVASDGAIYASDEGANPPGVDFVQFVDDATGTLRLGRNVIVLTRLESPLTGTYELGVVSNATEPAAYQMTLLENSETRFALVFS